MSALYFFLFFIVVFSLIAIFKNEKGEVLKSFSHALAYFSVINILIVEHYSYGKNTDTIFSWSIIIGSFAFLVYLFSDSDVKW